MEVRVNRNRILGDFKKYINLEDLVNSLCFREQEKGNVITKIVVNGNDCTNKGSSFFRSTQTDQVVSLEVVTENPFILAKDNYIVALDVHKDTMYQLDKIISFLMNNFKEGVRDISGSFFENLGLFINLVIKPRDLLSLEMELIEFENTKMSALIQQLFDCIRDLEDQYINSSDLIFAKWLQDKFKPLFTKWEKIVRYLIHELSKMNS